MGFLFGLFVAFALIGNELNFVGSFEFSTLMTSTHVCGISL